MKDITKFLFEQLNVNEANESIKDEKSFREYAENKFKEVFGDDLDEEKMNDTIDGILSDNKDDVDNDDPLYNDIVEFVITTGKASASLLQRKYKLGYNRAARIIDLLEERGIIGPQNGSKPREVLVTLDNEEE